jgi:hypothetical protein
MSHIVTISNGWTIDPQASTFAKTPDAAPTPLPAVSLASLVHFGASYLASQAAARTVIDGFKREWVKGAEGRKIADTPKGVVPASDSEKYRNALASAHGALATRLLEGYVLNLREGAADPYVDELDKLARGWLQGFATAKGWYSLPPKRKVAKDEDDYADPKGRYATFGDALAAFIVTTVDSKHFAMKDAEGKAWPMKTRPGTSLADLLVSEARRRTDLRAQAAPKTSLAADSDEATF